MTYSWPEFRPESNYHPKTLGKHCRWFHRWSARFVNGVLYSRRCSKCHKYQLHADGQWVSVR